MERDRERQRREGQRDRERQTEIGEREREGEREKVRQTDRQTHRKYKERAHSLIVVMSQCYGSGLVC